MKKLFFLITTVLIAILTSCSNDSGTFKILGSINIDDGEKIYRIVNTNNQAITIDSSIVKNSKFSFNGPVDYPDLNFLLVKKLNYSIPLVIEEGDIDVTIFKDSLRKSLAKGTISNDDLNRYNKESQSLTNSYNDIANEIGKASNLGDNILVADLQDQAKELQIKFFDFQNEFISDNRNSYIASLVLESVISSKSLGLDSVRKLYSNFSERIKNSSSGKNIYNVINKPINPTDIGQIAPNFEGPNEFGELVNLNDLKGKITIIDFWAAWCRPCRIENPNLVKLYKKMNKKGLEIVGVSLDRNKESWLKAIQDDGLIWSHVSNLKFWQDPIAKLYNITAIPAAFIIDEDGKILAKNLRGAALEEKIDELLN
jgi:peroxiredoxin